MNQQSKRLNIFITGAAGYVGAMLAEQFSTRSDVAEIICLDKEPMPELLMGNKKIFGLRPTLRTAIGRRKSVQRNPIS